MNYDTTRKDKEEEEESKKGDKDMTREEQIKKQADIYTDDASNYTEWSDDGGWSDTNDVDLVEKAFIEGAKWADNNIYLSSIWNDTNIVPSDNKGIIYLTKNNKLGVLNSIKSTNWDWYVADKYSIIKWAYIDDLLPKQFGNSEQLKGGEE